ncbi:hypothetical protein NARC_40247 [Candidatus Nitrosocosmicus arcticus]|uniref:Uncharacterized protein n=1 Tax=Candidatus Nitrosocosmicus arcticus TaxID=2035267 RepID=A0A557SXF7_9ARCH|nr:hypothetical protein NARC_40247 [Candidatus Nitrosocosmicus arcticus]
MIMCLYSRNVYKSFPIMERGVDLRKTRENRKVSKKALIAYTYVKLACDCNSEK